MKEFFSALKQKIFGRYRRVVDFTEYIKEWDDGTGLLASIFMLRVDVPEGGFDFDRYEVNDVRVMPFSEFYGHIMDHNDEEMGRGIRDIEARL